MLEIHENQTYLTLRMDLDEQETGSGMLIAKDQPPFTSPRAAAEKFAKLVEIEKGRRRIFEISSGLSSSSQQREGLRSRSGIEGRRIGRPHCAGRETLGIRVKKREGRQPKTWPRGAQLQTRNWWNSNFYDF